MAPGVNNSTHPNNQSNEEEDFASFYFDTSSHLPFVLLSILIVLVNTSVVLLFAFKRKLRVPCNYLFVSISVSDLLTGLVGLPLLLVCSATPSCLSCIFAYPFIRFTSISTILHILVITYERYAKIVFPFRTHRIGRKSFELKVMASLWCISLFVSLIPFAWVPFSEESCSIDEDDSVASKNNVYSIILLLAFVGLPLLLLIHADISVTFVVVRQLEKIDKTTVGGQNLRNRVRKESKIIAISAVMMLYFIACWSFYYAAVISHSINKELGNMPDWLVMTVDILRCSTPLVNPILYVFLKQDFRRAVRSVAKQLVNRANRQEGDSSVRYSNGVTTVGQTTRNMSIRTLLTGNYCSDSGASSKFELEPIQGTYHFGKNK